MHAKLSSYHPVEVHFPCLSSAGGPATGGGSGGGGGDGAMHSSITCDAIVRLFARLKVRPRASDGRWPLTPLLLDTATYLDVVRVLAAEETREQLESKLGARGVAHFLLPLLPWTVMLHAAAKMVYQTHFRTVFAPLCHAAQPQSEPALHAPMSSVLFQIHLVAESAHSDLLPLLRGRLRSGRLREEHRVYVAGLIEALETSIPLVHRFGSLLRSGASGEELFTPFFNLLALVLRLRHAPPAGGAAAAGPSDDDRTVHALLLFGLQLLHLRGSDHPAWSALYSQRRASNSSQLSGECVRVSDFLLAMPTVRQWCSRGSTVQS